MYFSLAHSIWTVVFGTSQKRCLKNTKLHVLLVLNTSYSGIQTQFKIYNKNTLQPLQTILHRIGPFVSFLVHSSARTHTKIIENKGEPSNWASPPRGVPSDTPKKGEKTRKKNRERKRGILILQFASHVNFLNRCFPKTREHASDATTEFAIETHRRAIK